MQCAPVPVDERKKKKVKISGLWMVRILSKGMNFDIRTISVNGDIEKMGKNKKRPNSKQNTEQHTPIIISNHQHFIVCTCKIYWHTYLVHCKDHCPKWGTGHNWLKKIDTMPLLRFITYNLYVLHFSRTNHNRPF